MRNALEKAGVGDVTSGDDSQQARWLLRCDGRDAVTAPQVISCGLINWFARHFLRAEGLLHLFPQHSSAQSLLVSPSLDVRVFSPTERCFTSRSCYRVGTAVWAYSGQSSGSYCPAFA